MATGVLFGPEPQIASSLQKKRHFLFNISSTKVLARVDSYGGELAALVDYTIDGPLTILFPEAEA